MQFLLFALLSVTTTVILSNMFLNTCVGFGGTACYVDVGLSASGLIFSITGLMCLAYPILFIYAIAERSNYTANVLSLNREYNGILLVGVMFNVISILLLFTDITLRVYLRDWMCEAIREGSEILLDCGDDTGRAISVLSGSLCDHTLEFGSTSPSLYRTTLNIYIPHIYDFL